MDDIPYIPCSALAVPGVPSRDLIATKIHVNDKVAESPINNLAPVRVPLSDVVVPTIPSSALTAASVPDSNPTAADVPLRDIPPVGAPLSNLAAAGVSDGDVSKVVTDDAIDKAAASEGKRLEEERATQEVIRKEEEMKAAQLVKLGQEAATAEVTRPVTIRLKSEALQFTRLKAAAAAESIRQEQEVEAEGVLKMTPDGAIKKAEVNGSGLKGAAASASNLNAQGIDFDGAIDFDGGDCGGNDDVNNSNESRGKMCLFICKDHIMHINDVD